MVVVVVVVIKEKPCSPFGKQGWKILGYAKSTEFLLRASATVISQPAHRDITLYNDHPRDDSRLKLGRPGLHKAPRQ
jgi:hypothetical protein